MTKLLYTKRMVIMAEKKTGSVQVAPKEEKTTMNASQPVKKTPNFIFYADAEDVNMLAATILFAPATFAGATTMGPDDNNGNLPPGT